MKSTEPFSHRPTQRRHQQTLWSDTSMPGWIAPYFPRLTLPVSTVLTLDRHPGAQTRPLTPCKKLPPELSLSISFVKCFCCYERVHFVFRRSHEICVFAKYAQYITTPQRYLGFLLSPYRSRNNRTITSSLWVTETVERWCDEIVMGWRWEGLYRGGESLTEMEWALRSMDTHLFSLTRSCRWLAVVSLPFLASLIHPYCFTWHHRAS